MPSAKKLRGKQRKAAAAAAAAAAAGGGRPALATDGWRGGRRQREYSTESSPGAVIEAISRGETHETEFVAFDLCGGEGDDVVKAFVEHLVDDGLIRIVLGFVDQCQHVSVAEVVTGQRAPIKEVASNPVVNPCIWICLLSNLVAPDGLPTKESSDRCRLGLALGIQPLVTCFQSTSREFFRSKKHWHYGLQALVSLINNIAMADYAVGVLFEHRGLTDMLAQCLFLGTHRPDIAEESKVFGRLDFQSIAHTSVDILDVVIKTWGYRSDGRVWYFDKCATRRLNTIGRTPIVSKPYRTNGRVPLVIGMIEQLPSQQYQSYFSRYCYVLLTFIGVGCVDKDVISAALRSAQMLEYNAAVMIADMMVGMLNPMVEGKRTPCDNKFAFAIDQGLLIESFILLGEHQNESDGRLVAKLQTLLETAFSVSMQMKSSRAIARQRNELIEAIRTVEIALANKREEIQKIVRLVKMIVLLQENIESYTRDCCHGCGKILMKEEIKRCSRCGTFYCSRNCQRKDWENGDHAFHCANDTTLADEKAAKRKEVLYRNLCAVTKKLMNENHLGLLNEVVLLEHDIMDCVVFINLVKPPVIRVMLASSFLRGEEDSVERARLQQAIDRNRANGAVTCFTNYLVCEPNGAEQVNVVAMGHHHHTGSWQDALMKFKKGERATGGFDSERLFFRY